MIILSIDIGIIHLGLASVEVDQEWNVVYVDILKLYNITIFKHRYKDISCKKFHTACFSDWVDHLITYHKKLFINADYILLELQPPCGLKGIEQLIFHQYRNKCILIHPASVHKSLHMGHLDYENRKKYSVYYAKKWLGRFDNSGSLLKKINKYKRKHDVADALCMIIYWTKLKAEEYRIEKNMERLKTLVPSFSKTGVSIHDWMEFYRFVEPKYFIS